MPWHGVWPGALFVTVTTAIGNAVFPVYLTSVSDLDRIGGALGFILIALIWFYLSRLAILAGAVINALRYELHDTGASTCRAGGARGSASRRRQRGVSGRVGVALRCARAGARRGAAAAGEADPPDAGPSRPQAGARARSGRFDEPVYLAQAPGGEGTLYVAERGGRDPGVSARRRVGRGAVPGPLARTVSTEGEGGLFSLAFAPDYERERPPLRGLREQAASLGGRPSAARPRDGETSSG